MTLPPSHRLAARLLQASRDGEGLTLSPAEVRELLSLRDMGDLVGDLPYLTDPDPHDPLYDGEDE